MNMDCGHDGDDSSLRASASQPGLAIGYNFEYSVADLLKCWTLWHLFRLELGRRQ